MIYNGITNKIKVNSPMIDCGKVLSPSEARLRPDLWVDFLLYRANVAGKINYKGITTR